jgi:UDP-N-acetylmuramoylalanine--D-glutamate ligase
VNRIVRNFINDAILTGKKAVVVGTGKSGLAAARLLDVLGADVRVADRDEAVTEEKLGALAGRY